MTWLVHFNFTLINRSRLSKCNSESDDEIWWETAWFILLQGVHFLHVPPTRPLEFPIGNTCKLSEMYLPFRKSKPYTRNSNPNYLIISSRDLDKPFDFRNVIKSSHSKTTFASVFTYFLKILEYLLHPVWRCFQWVSFKLVVTYYNLLFFYCYFQFFVPSYNVGTYTFYLYAALHLLPIYQCYSVLFSSLLCLGPWLWGSFLSEVVNTYQ